MKTKNKISSKYGVILIVILSAYFKTIAKQITRDPDKRKDFANVFYKPQYTLFDLWSDEAIYPDSDGNYHIYYATNENKVPIEFTGNSQRLSTLFVYKFKNYNNCKNWCLGISYDSPKNSTQSKKQVYPYISKVIIRGVNDVNANSLNAAADIVSDFFGYPVDIDVNITLNEDYFIDGTQTINGDKFIDNANDKNLTIYVTNKNIKALNINSRGVSRIKGKTVLSLNGEFMKETIIHELGHVFGLYHCDNLACVMAINNDDYDLGKFCDKCMNSIANN
jgi:hypothetical protein